MGAHEVTQEPVVQDLLGSELLDQVEWCVEVSGTFCLVTGLARNAMTTSLPEMLSADNAGSPSQALHAKMLGVRGVVANGVEVEGEEAAAVDMEAAAEGVAVAAMVAAEMTVGM